jgi:hypothetical protein
MVRQPAGLRALQMRVRGHQGIELALGSIDDGLSQPLDRRARLVRLAPRPQA